MPHLSSGRSCDAALDSPISKASAPSPGPWALNMLAHKAARVPGQPMGLPGVFSKLSRISRVRLCHENPIDHAIRILPRPKTRASGDVKLLGLSPRLWRMWALGEERKDTKRKTCSLLVVRAVLCGGGGGGQACSRKMLNPRYLHSTVYTTDCPLSCRGGADHGLSPRPTVCRFFWPLSPGACRNRAAIGQWHEYLAVVAEKRSLMENLSLCHCQAV